MKPNSCPEVLSDRLLKKQSDRGLYCLLFLLHLFNILYGKRIITLIMLFFRCFFFYYYFQVMAFGLFMMDNKENSIYKMDQRKRVNIAKIDKILKVQ